MDKMRMESLDMTAQNIEKIGALFPNCITETVDENGKPKKAINFDLLKQMLSGDVIEGSEAYEFTWVGKKAAIVEANRPIRKTLRPYKYRIQNHTDNQQSQRMLRALDFDKICFNQKFLSLDSRIKGFVLTSKIFHRMIHCSIGKSCGGICFSSDFNRLLSTTYLRSDRYLQPAFSDNTSSNSFSI